LNSDQTVRKLDSAINEALCGALCSQEFLSATESRHMRGHVLSGGF